MNKSLPRTAILVVGLLLTSWSPAGFAAGCLNSPVLFAYRGSLFAVLLGQKPVEIASGFKAPSDITWAPGCGHYALIDSESLWVGGYPGRPSKAVFPGPVLGYRWRPNGRELVATVRPTVCDRRTRLRASVDEGDTFTVAVSGLVSRSVTSDCVSRTLSWSPEGNRLILNRQALGPCPITVPVCPTGNVVAVALRSSSVWTLIKATYLREKKLDDPEIVKWDDQSNLLYIWSMTSPIGGLGALLAVRVPSGKIMWSMESYGAKLLTDGRIANLDRKDSDLEKTGLNWEWRYRIIRRGKVVAEYPALPTSGECGIATNGQYIWWQPTDSENEIHFATNEEADTWVYPLPQGVESVNHAWSPDNFLVVQSYKRASKENLLLDIWLLDPAKKRAAKLFEGASALMPNADPDSVAYGMLSVAQWAR